jgi:hypothetical protein
LYKCILQAAYALVVAACKAGRAPTPVPAEERRFWLLLAARALSQVCIRFR